MASGALADRPLVSVVIPTHGRPAQVRTAVASVMTQDYPGAIDCVVVHDGEPPDGDLEHSAQGRSVRVVANRDHCRGLPGARNAGLDVVRGDLVASLDDDDAWYPAKVREQVTALVDHPEVFVVATGIVLRASGGREWVRVPPRLVTHEDLVRHRIMELHSSNLMMRREVFDLVGRYDEDVPLPEDYEWLLRASRLAPILTVQRPLAWIDRSRPLGTGGRWSYRAIGREKLLVKHPELAGTRHGAVNVYGGIAFAHAAAGSRRRALWWIARCASCGRFGRWATAAALVTLGIPASWIEATAGRLGKSV